ncbi:MAG: hypothetical protein K6A35_01725 [bacterium]|jgi:hypothetical protein|nr:hypothetical protein [bacterium]
MALYKEEYLQKYFDNFDFFEPQCRDKRLREVNMRNKRCLSCPGFEKCQTFPEYWLKGEENRQEVNDRL